jgi:PAS domain S-box-containing protein
VFGWTAEEAVGQLADITFTPEDRGERVPAKEREAAARDGRVPNVRWHHRKDGRRIFIDGIASALRDADGTLTGFLKIGQDVTERRRADERQKTLLAELQHRVRNILAVIRSIARRSADGGDTVEGYAQHLDGRITALARTQALLTREVQAGVDLEGLLLDELVMQAAQPDQFKVTGAPVSLAPKAAEVLGLALHELATNSVKYGALSTGDGRVDVRWTLLEGEEGPQLSLIWSEFGVRIGSEPRRRGFGTELITERVPYELQGSGTMDFRETGLVATIEFPLTETGSILQTDDSVRGAG